MNKKYIPEGFHSITPYFRVENAQKFIEFLEKAFNAQCLFISNRNDGSIANAQIKIDDSIIEVSDSTMEMPPMYFAIHLYVEDVDFTFQKAVKEGAIAIMQPENREYGDRDSFIKDPFGNSWYIATHLNK